MDAAPRVAPPPRSVSARQCLGFLVALSCFPVVLADLTPTAPNQFDFHALVFPADLALLALIVIAVRRRRLPPLAATAAVVLLTLGAAWLFHPSLRGGVTLLRLAGVVAIAAVADRRTALTLTGTWAVVESLIAVAQRVHGGPLGLNIAGEDSLSFVHFGRSLAPPGTLVHPYLLAGLALLGGSMLANAARDRDRRWLLVPAAIAVAPVGFTYSRAALVGLGLMLICFVVARFPAAVVALALGAGIPALMWSGGWVARAEQTAAAGDVDTGRSILIHQSLDTIRGDPLTGVGPGRYVTAQRERGVDPTPTGGYFKPVHNIVLLAAGEGGVLAGLAMLGLLVIAGFTAIRAGAASVAVFAGFLPFCMLDHFAYTFPQGLVMMGLWLAALSTGGAGRAPLVRAE